MIASPINIHMNNPKTIFESRTNINYVLIDINTNGIKSN